MLNKLIREFKTQKARFSQRKQVNDHQSKNLKVFEKKPELLRYRLLRTYVKDKPTENAEENSKTKGHNFEADDLTKALELHDAIVPARITRHSAGYFMLMFESNVQAAAFKECNFYFYFYFFYILSFHRKIAHYKNVASFAHTLIYILCAI
ncbi:hypothetical protein RFI_16637 [Reticulomyxa filosa]|uniref:Uncharacterized protein n=1 Tax=Reticulomyxa filosa TaxID=46433 RepID=X6N3C9_RETFI|nr:hypothetical protein RFI_16637 [Reticulomyxa filosa]|eukprot:ETO20581.1 hypothetical protein RFI_16637 [Reticulomyxa filosa]